MKVKHTFIHTMMKTDVCVCKHAHALLYYLCFYATVQYFINIGFFILSNGVFLAINSELINVQKPMKTTFNFGIKSICN